MRKFNLDWQKGYEEGLKVGIENENNRIIKLFENIKKEPSSAEYWLHKVARTAFATAAIKLIEREQK